MLSFKNVTKTFGDITSLDDINLDIEKGEFVFLTGPSGAGKTTLLRLILRDLIPDSGEILLAGEDIANLHRKHVPALRQQIGFVFQDFKVLPTRTLRENIEVALAVTDIAKNEWKDRVDHVLKLVKLSDRDSLFPSQLSGGETQRASLARALVINPKIIIADEATGNLDWETAYELMQLFEKVNNEGKTIIMATHHQGILDKMKKRRIEIDKGKIVKGGKSKKEPKKKSDSKTKEGNKDSESLEEKKVQVEVEVKNKEKGKSKKK